MSLLKNKFIKFLLFFAIPTSCVIILVLAYISFKKLALPHNTVLKSGQKISEYAASVRKSFLAKNKNFNFVKFNSKDGVKLAGYLVKNKNAKANLLICHGFGSCKEFHFDETELFPNFNILLFDFRAHGQSKGNYRTLGCHEYKDVIAAAQFLNEKTKVNKNQPNKLPLIIWGFSMGGSSAIKALEYEPNLADAFIIDSSFYDLKKVIQSSFALKSNLPNFPFLPMLEAVTNKLACCKLSSMKPINNLKNTDKPFFFIHSCADKIVPIQHGLEMYRAGKNPNNKLWICKNSKHCHIIDNQRQRYQHKVNKFLKKTVGV